MVYVCVCVCERERLRSSAVCGRALSPGIASLAAPTSSSAPLQGLSSLHTIDVSNNRLACLDGLEHCNALEEVSSRWVESSQGGSLYSHALHAPTPRLPSPR